MRRGELKKGESIARNYSTLIAPEMTVLFGGIRFHDDHYDALSQGVVSGNQGLHTRDFFVNLLDMFTRREKVDDYSFISFGHATGAARQT